MTKFPEVKVAVDTGKVTGLVRVVAQGVTDSDDANHLNSVYLDFFGQHRDYTNPTCDGYYSLTTKAGDEVLASSHAVQHLDKSWTLDPSSATKGYRIGGRFDKLTGKRDTANINAALLGIVAELDAQFLTEGQRARLTDNLERARTKEDEAKKAWMEANEVSVRCMNALEFFNEGNPKPTAASVLLKAGKKETIGID